ncbi:tyrosine-type recombinase/integrase [Salinispora tropica]|uniref:Tyr recombinase domain-containing protein n=1 Tax=Salinispora tropica (strain ATCC BAA-916 / DSM 44818 / JCM 13857 / NBRC 105044 / CNB-440) TaxID=369723 RepID=A4XA99_SALTO|nr:tyrosine-type recombinase/integrase [Salinispora tropica]ABP55848.1 hypothetical protein Strop_3417 [Salinispora tropica CNB-440]
MVSCLGHGAGGSPPTPQLGPLVRRVRGWHSTGATLLLAQGVDIRVIQELLGHSSIKIAEGYTHVASKLARDATKRMGKRLFGTPGTP